MIERGCEVFLTTVVASADPLASMLAHILVVKEVEYAVDLAPGTTPISGESYWMTPLELRELKI